MARFTQMGFYLTSGVAVLGVLALFNSNTPTVAADAADGSKIFSQNCATCHAGGGNIVDAKKPLKGSKELASKQTLKELLLKPRGAMTAFPKIAESDPQLSALYDYCKSLK